MICSFCREIILIYTKSYLIQGFVFLEVEKTSKTFELKLRKQTKISMCICPPTYVQER